MGARWPALTPHRDSGVLIFAGLTAYNNQKLRQMYAQQGEAGNLALQGALTLLLRVFGKRRS